MTRTKRATLGILSILLLMTTVSATALAELKIGYIRPTYIFSQYEPYLEAQDKLAEFQDAEIAKLNEMQDELLAKQEEYQQKNLMMTEQIQQQSQQEILAMNQAIQESYDELTREDGLLAQKQQELISPIIDDINDILMEIGDVEEYDLIFDATSGGLIFADEQYDLSDRVLSELKKGFTAE